MRILVTGATGLLGRGACRALTERGHEVLALIRPGSAAPAGSIPVVHDLREPFRPDRAFELECILHLAHHPNVEFPENASALHRLNTSSTQELLEVARLNEATRFVYASSGTVYGWSGQPLDERGPARAADYYALTKLHAEALSKAYAPYFATTVLRPFFPYGPGQRDRLIPRLADRIRRGEPVALRADERPRVNPVYVADAVEAVVAAVEGRTPDVLNLAGPDVVSIRELAVAIGRAVEREPTFTTLADTLPGDLVAATKRLVEVLGRPLTPLADGLASTFAATPT